MPFQNDLFARSTYPPRLQRRQLYPKRITFDDSVQFPIYNEPQRQNSKIPTLDTNFSLFDIPHIVDAIYQHLDQVDIWKCCLVGRAWHNAFISYCYRNVRFNDLSPRKTWITLENAHFIRRLDIDPLDGEYFFQKPTSYPLSYQDAPSVRCIALRELRCVQSNYACTCGSEYEFVCRVCEPPGFINSINLIMTNPLLERIDLIFLWFTERHFTIPQQLNSNIIRSFSELRYLRSLKISSLDEKIDMRQLLIHLPRSLEQFHIRSTTTIHDSDENILTVATNLKSLFIIDHNPWYAQSLLKQSPMLEGIGLNLDHINEHTWTEVLIKSCPRIHSIYLDYSADGDEFIVNHLSKLLYSYEAVHTIRLNMYDLPSISEMLSSHHLTSLHSIYLAGEYCRVGNGKILRTCPNLQVFSITGCLLELLRDDDGDDEDDVRPKWFSEYRYKPWVCRNLKVFDVLFSSAVFSDEEFERNMETICYIRMLHHELRSLSNLQDLDLRWDLDMDKMSLIYQEFRDRLLSDDGQPNQYKLTKDDLIWMNIRPAPGGYPPGYFDIEKGFTYDE